MTISNVGICNLALATLGEESIRDFDEGNKKARMCDRFFGATRDYLLEQFSWPFAQQRAKLRELATPENWYPDGVKVYGVPADCLKPLDLYPEGSHHTWEVLGQEMAVDERISPVVLCYTGRQSDPTKFSMQFVNLLALALAVRICMPVTSDKELTKTIFQQYLEERREAWSVDAAIGRKHLHNDANPKFDSFVDPDYSFTE